jgi:hypothetical protein
MFEALNTPEISRLALVIGTFAAVTYKNISGVNPGGVIVPGLIIILFLISPIWCISILALAFLVYFIYERFLEKTSYKRRTPMYILSTISLAIANLVALVYVQLGWLVPSLDNLSGTLLPAVIAFTFTKQKMRKVVKGIAVTTLATAFSLAIVYLIGSYLLNINFDTLRPLYAGKETLEFKFPLIQFYIALAVGYLFYRYKGVRSGGYMVAPVAAALLVYPLSAVIFLLGCFVVYLVTQSICEVTLTIGLNRYALALFLSTMFVWSTEIIFLNLDATILPFKGSNLFVIVAMMSYVNDGILYAKKQIFIYMLATVAVAIVTYLFTKEFSTEVLS